MGLRPAIQCPECEDRMGPHCAGWRCWWAFCKRCGISYDIKRKKYITKGY